MKKSDAIEKTLAAQDGAAQRAEWLGRIRGNLPIFAACGDVGETLRMLEGHHAIVAGAGPSLSKNVHLLKGLEKSHPLFCCDRALPMLRDAGVIPHFVVVGDASESVAGFFSGCETRKSILVAPYFAHPKVFALPWRHVLVYAAVDYDVQFMAAASNIVSRARPAGFTAIQGGLIVGNTAFLCARIADCAAIAFVGCDMSMKEPPDGAAAYERVGDDGEKVYSLPGYLAGFEWLLNRIELDTDIKDGKVMVYNSTEGGIMYSESLPGMPLAVYLEKYSGAGKSVDTAIRRRLGK